MTPGPTDEAPAAGPLGGPRRPTAAALRAAVDGYFASLDALDVEAVVARFAPGGSLECVSDGRRARGADELHAFLHGVCDGSRGMEHPVVWAAVDAAAGRVATVQEYRDRRDSGAVYDERTCNLFELDAGCRLVRVRFWRAP